MKKESLEGILAKHPFFKGLPSKYIRLFNGCAKNAHFQEGEYLFHTGGKAEQFYLIREGEISLEIFAPGQGQKIIQVLGDNEVVGWSWLFPPYKWHFDAKALKPTRAIVLDGVCIRKKCEKDDKLGHLLMKRFAFILMQRLQATRSQFLELNELLPVKPWWKPGIP